MDKGVERRGRGEGDACDGCEEKMRRRRIELTNNYILYLEYYTCCTVMGSRGRRNMNAACCRGGMGGVNAMHRWTIKITSCFCKIEHKNYIAKECKLEALLSRYTRILAEHNNHNSCCYVKERARWRESRIRKSEEELCGTNCSDDTNPYSINRFLRPAEITVEFLLIDPCPFQHVLDSSEDSEEETVRSPFNKNPSEATGTKNQFS